MSESQPRTEISADDNDHVWQLVADRIEAFLDAWESQPEAPDLASFLPARPDAVRRLTLIELIKADMEHRWQPGQEGPTVETYVARFPELESPAGVSCDLVYEEFHIRRRCGDNVQPEEYFARFPQQDEELRRLLSLQRPTTTTAVLPRRPSTKIDVGDQLDDFDLLAELGQGAFATVYLARQRSMQRLVALKLSADRGTEPQTLAQLDHPHIVRVYDQRRMADEGLRLLYMQYVAGGTLHDVVSLLKKRPPKTWNGTALLAIVDESLDRHGAAAPAQSLQRQRLAEMSWPDIVCFLGAQLADALEYAHHQGVLHRDLKPANVLLTDTASPKLVDFNVSSCSKLEGASPASYFGGSLAYMSPEQLEACNPQHPRDPDSLDGRSDVYSLGVVLWELMSGRRPFQDPSLKGGWSTTVADMVARRQSGVDGSARNRLPRDCPPELCDVLVKCLQPDRDQRYQSAGTLAQQLNICLQPDARRLFAEPSRGWRRAVVRYPLLLIIIVVLLPNGLAGWFNYVYNRQAIVDRLGDSQSAFWWIQLAVNGIAFPLGIGLGIWIAWPLVRNLRAKYYGHVENVVFTPALRRRCLRLGHYLATLSFCEWLVAGIIYPAALLAAGTGLDKEGSIHFFSSLTLCGLIAAAYPFFGITALAVHGWYPALLRPDGVDPQDVPVIHWVHHISWRYLALAAVVPMFGVMLLVTLGQAQNRFAMITLCAAGLVGLLLSYYLARLIQANLNTLVAVANRKTDASG